MYLKYRKNIFSQNGEDGIIDKILQDLNIKDNICVCEFGAWDGKQDSNTFNLVYKRNAKALMIEGDESKFEDLLKTSKKYPSIIPVNKFVCPTGNNSLDSILDQNKFPIDFDLLSIDVDSNDLEIWENLKKYKPKIVIIEINSSILPGVKQRYDPAKNNIGNSFSSTLEVAYQKSYVPVVHTGNLILLKKELLKELNLENDFNDNPNNLFIYDWVDKKNFDNSFMNKILKILIPNFIRKMITPNIKYLFQRFLN